MAIKTNLLQKGGWEKPKHSYAYSNGKQGKKPQKPMVGKKGSK